MDGKSEQAEPFRQDTVLSDGYLIAAVEAELHADAAEDVLDDETLQAVADAVEARTGEPVRLAHESELDPSFDTSVYHRGDDYPGLLLTTSVELDGFGDQRAAVEELQRRRDTLSRVCEEMELISSVVSAEELAERVERYRAREE